MIYFLRHVETGLIKIGKTRDIFLRLPQLTSRYGELELMGFMDGDYVEESTVHLRFELLRSTVLAGREWFNPDVALMDYIHTHTTLTPPERVRGRKRPNVATCEMQIYADDSQLLDFVLLGCSESTNQADLIHKALRSYYAREIAILNKHALFDKEQSA